MLKKLYILSCLATLPVFGMKTEKSLMIKPWVNDANQVCVQSIKTSFDIKIDDTTTLLDLKKELEKSEGISVNSLAITPIYRSAWNLWLIQKMGPKLDDAVNIKKIMNEYNTARFMMWLKLNKTLSNDK